MQTVTNYLYHVWHDGTVEVVSRANPGITYRASRYANEICGHATRERFDLNNLVNLRTCGEMMQELLGHGAIDVALFQLGEQRFTFNIIFCGDHNPRRDVWSKWNRLYRRTIVPTRRY